MPNNTQKYTREHAQEHTQERVYAGFAVRLAAYLVDLLLVSTVLLVVRIPLWVVELASPENILVWSDGWQKMFSSPGRGNRRTENEPV